MTKFACVMTLVASIAMTGASAAQDLWTEAEVCQAGLEVYFFLEVPPKLTSDSGDRMTFKSARGLTYSCSIEGNHVVFNWRSDAGGMSSKSTTYAQTGTTLTISSDMSTKVFTK